MPVYCTPEALGFSESPFSPRRMARAFERTRTLSGGTER